MKEGVLNHLRARLAGWLVLRVFLSLLATAGLLALAAVLGDAAMDLSGPTRVAAPWVIGGCCLGIILLGLERWRRLSEIRAARMFERAHPALGSKLTNAVQLATQPGKSAVEEFLRRESIELGRARAAGLETWLVMRRRLKAAMLGAAMAVLGWLGLVLFADPLLQAVLPRFFDPAGDHPPFSLVKFAVTPGSAEVLYGGQLDVKATISGQPVDKLWLVAASATNSSRTIMFLAPDGSFFQTLANLREPAQYFVTDGRARSRKFSIAIRYTPRITLLELTTTFPSYTGKPPRTAKLADEPQALPEGTTVSFRIASNRPLKSGALDLTPVLGGKTVRIQLQPETQPNIVTGGFTLSDPTLFTIHVTDVNGLDSSDQRKGRFNILPDERPRLFVLEPGRDAVATPSIRIPVRVQATDDYGVTRILWLRGLNRSLERPFNFKLEMKGGPQSVEAAGEFDLAKLGVRPGDVIEYYFEAADNYPKGPNVTLSRFYRLEVISEAQCREILSQAAARKALFEPYFQLDNWLKRLAERARDLEDRAGSGTDADKQNLAADTKKLADDLEQYQEQLGKLLGQALMFDVERSFRESLAVEHTVAGELKDELQKLGAGSGLPNPAKLSEISRRLGDLAGSDQEDVSQPAGQIAAVARLMAHADLFVKLAQEQAAVAKSLRRFTEDTASLSRLEQMEVQELAHQQRLIQEGLRNLLGSLDDSLKELPDEPQFDDLRKDVNGFTAAVADAKIENDIKSAATALAGADPGSGFDYAQSAADKMDKLISKCNGMNDRASQCLRFKPKLQQALGNTLQQILAAMGAGSGQNGQDGYSLFNNDVGLYGPNAEVAGEQGGKRGESGSGSARATERFAKEAGEPDQPKAAAAGRVHLQTDAKFPLRYRDLVGDYFRAIAESQNEEEHK